MNKSTKCFLIPLAFVLAATLTALVLHNDSNDPENGERVVRIPRSLDPSGDSEEKKELKQNQREQEVADGIVTRVHPSGQKSMEMPYQKGEQEGPASFWHENGRKAAEGGFLRGVRHGRVTAWHQNGQKASVGIYKDGLKHGKVTTWLENGQMWEEGEYRSGKRHGEFVLYDEDGKSVKLTYEDGRLVNRRRVAP